MMKAIAVDDEPLALDIIKEFCSQVEGIELVGTFTKPSKAIEYLEQNQVDLLFLDINMPTITGIDFSKNAAPNIMTIFTTAYSEYAVEGFNLSAVDYLLKPFEFDRFQKAAEKAKDYYNYLHGKNTETAEYLFIKVDYSITKIPLVDIDYIEGQDNYIKVHLSNGKNHLVRMSMKTIADQLPKKDFLRVHRSYIVAFKKITALRNKTVYLGNLQLPVSAPYQDEVSKHFS